MRGWAREGLILLALSAVQLGACSGGGGYTMGSLHDTSVRTVAVPIFENETYSNGLGAKLTEAIITEIHSTTPWRVVPVAEAQTTLSGTITNARLRTLAIERGYVEQSVFVLTVDFAWKDNARGEAKVAREGFSSAGSFIPVRGVGEPIEVGQREAMAELARDIVAELAADW